MSQTYTEGFTIPVTGTSAGCMALLNATTTTATAIVVPWRNAAGATCSVSLAPGEPLPLKVREVKSSTQILTGLL
jgi:hypothetical protein